MYKTLGVGFDEMKQSQWTNFIKVWTRPQVEHEPPPQLQRDLYKISWGAKLVCAESKGGKERQKKRGEKLINFHLITLNHTLLV